MERTMKLLLLALCALAAFPLRTASAQSLARFAPLAPSAPGSEALELRFVRERSGHVQAQVWPAQELGWLFVREEGAQRNYDALAPSPEDARLVRVERGTQGVALVGWDLPARVEASTGGEVRAFLAERGFQLALPTGLEALLAEQAIAVQRIESLALLARATRMDSAPEPSAVATSKTGQRMELRAILDPSFAAAGSEFCFRLYLPAGGAGAGDALLWARAVHLPSGEVRAVEVLPDRSLRTKLDRPGPWMLEAHRLRPLEAGGPGTTPGAEVELASSTLVFDVRAVPEAGKGDGR